MNLISLPIETTGETIIEHIMFIKELGLKVGVWGWEGIPLLFFEPLIPYVDIIEYENVTDSGNRHKSVGVRIL